MFTSQHGEDKWISEHWAELKLPDRGFFVEFGAGDGQFVSNTYWLEHEKNWCGLLCEPDPRHQIPNRHRSVIERVAVGPGPKKITLGQPDDPFLSGERRTAESFVPQTVAKRSCEVQQVPLSLLLQKHKVAHVDLISIDTEGTELEAWRTLDLVRWRPRVAIIELQTWGLDNRSNETIQAMMLSGYRMVYTTGLNGIFADII